MLSPNAEPVKGREATAALPHQPMNVELETLEMEGSGDLALRVASWTVTTNQLLFGLQTPSKDLHQLKLLKPE